jgi:hypothetical protein
VMRLSDIDAGDWAAEGAREIAGRSPHAAANVQDVSVPTNSRLAG